MRRLPYVIGIILALAGCGGNELASSDMAISCANGNTQRWSVPCCDRLQPGQPYPTGACVPLDACYDYNDDLMRCSCGSAGKWVCYHVAPRDMATATDGGGRGD
jgi:hypothetical protein